MLSLFLALRHFLNQKDRKMFKIFLFCIIQHLADNSNFRANNYDYMLS
jgi:hypothetical protein